MKFLIIIWVMLCGWLQAEPGAADVAAIRYTELMEKSKTITQSSTQEEVRSMLGEPQDKGNGGWGRFDRISWNYLNYQDPSRYLRFTVWFDPKDGCSIQAESLQRSEIEKVPLKVVTGVMASNNPGPDVRIQGGAVWNVQFTFEGREVLLGVAVDNMDRVKGSPKAGSKIEIHYRGEDLNFIFLGSRALYLESIVFAEKE